MYGFALFLAKWHLKCHNYRKKGATDAVFQKKVIITFHAGLDYAFRLSRGEQFDYTDQSGRKNSVGYDGDTPETNDFRVTIGASIIKKRWTLDLNYKHGLSNYNTNGNSKVFERILHIRVMYAFLKV